MHSFHRRTLLPSLLAVGALLMAGCSSPPAGAAGDDGDRLIVAASFYPVQFLAERLGGDAVKVAGLTPAGTEPHSLSLTGPALAGLQEADVLFHIGGGLQPEVEKAIGTLPAGTAVVDLLKSPGLELIPASADDHGHEEAGENDPDEAAHEGSASDPHFWLDPVRYATAAKAVAAELTRVDPDNAEVYARNLAQLTAELDALNATTAGTLETCGNRTLVVAHSAFGYFADRYRLRQVGIAGLSPDDEPDAKTLVGITAAAAEAGVDTVFFEQELPPRLASTVADSIGASVDSLTTLEFVPADGGYLETMAENARRVGAGLDCR